MAESAPDYVTVVCPVCRTRLHPRAGQEARRVKCPDCFTPVPVPARGDVPLPEPKAPPVEVGTYRLAVAETPAVLPESATVVCSVCRARLHPAVRRRARTIKCPDCDSPVRVPARDELPPPAVPRPLADVGQYQTAAAIELPPPATRWLEAQAEIREAPPPPLPRWTFFSGVFTFPWHGDVIARWGFMTAGFTAVNLVSLLAVRVAGGVAGYSGVVLAFFVLPLIWLTIWSCSYAAACCLAVLQDTGNGNDEITAWPEPHWKEWAACLIYVSFQAIVAGTAAWAAGRLGLLLAGTFWPVFLGTMVLLYPVVLLSSLEANSAWIPLTGPIVRSLGRLWWGWLLFYAELGLLACLWPGLPLLASAHFPLLTTLLSGPLLAAVLLIAARLLGRLAWRAAQVDVTK